MTVGRFLLFAAAVCFGVAVLAATGTAFASTPDSAWIAGGLLSGVLAQLIP